MGDHKAALKLSSAISTAKHQVASEYVNLAACYIEQAAQLGAERTARKEAELRQAEAERDIEKTVDEWDKYRLRAEAAESKLAAVEAVMPRIVQLLTETIDEHRTSIYNNCDRYECNWCTTAREVIHALKESAAAQNEGSLSRAEESINGVGPASAAALQDKYEDFHPKELDAPTDEGIAPRIEGAEMIDELPAIRAALRKNPLISMFMDTGFWSAHFVDIVIRYNGEDRRYEADWIKDIWYAAMQGVKQNAEAADEQGKQPDGEVVAGAGSLNDLVVIKWISDYHPKVGDKIYAAPSPDALLAAELRGMEKAADICNAVVETRFGNDCEEAIRAEAERLQKGG